MQTIKGTIYQIAPIETVGRKGTTKRIVVVKTSAKYENLVPIEVYKDHCNVFDSIKVGQPIAVEVDVVGREYQGRYYASIRYVSHVVKTEDSPEPIPMPQEPSMIDEIAF